MAAITRGELLLIDVEEFEILLEHEDVFGAVVPAQGGDDLGLGGATPDSRDAARGAADCAGRRRCRGGSAGRSPR